MIITFYKNLFIRMMFMPVKSLFGGGDKSGSKAANAQVQANQASIDEMKRQFGITQENIAPFLQAGQGAVPGVEAGATVGGMDAMTEAARVPTDLGLMLEQMLNGRQTNLMTTGLNAATGLGQMGQQNSAGIGNMMSASGNAISSGIITDAQAKAQGQQNMLNTAATIGSMFMGFSDPRLKINVEPVADIKGLNVYQWDWTPETKGTLVEGCATIGFMADEVQEKYPQHIHEFGGFMVVDYPALLDELEAA
jgi:hypothetical protein